MNLEIFKFKHFSLLIELLKSQKYPSINDIEMKTLPKIGFLAVLNKEPIACGFLRRLEPCYAHIDTLVSNGYFGSKIRHEGINLVVDALLLEAKRLKLKGIVAHTADAGIIKRAGECGFNIVEQTIIALDMNDEKKEKI